jgi:hypothetical protein
MGGDEPPGSTQAHLLTGIATESTVGVAAWRCGTVDDANSGKSAIAARNVESVASVCLCKAHSTSSCDEIPDTGVDLRASTPPCTLLRSAASASTVVRMSHCILSNIEERPLKALLNAATFLSKWEIASFVLSFAMAAITTISEEPGTQSRVFVLLISSLLGSSHNFSFPFTLCFGIAGVDTTAVD